MGRRRYRSASGACDLCGAHAEVVHHKDWDHGNNSATNLVDLCQRCHGHLHDAGLESYDLLRRAVHARRAQGAVPLILGAEPLGGTNSRGQLRCRFEEHCAPAILFEVQVLAAAGHASIKAWMLAQQLRRKLACAAEATTLFEVPRRREDRGGRFDEHLNALAERGQLRAHFQLDRQCVVMRVDVTPPVQVYPEVEKGWWRYAPPDATAEPHS